jgi:hypothetical protein
MITAQTLEDNDAVLRQSVLDHILRFHPQTGATLLREIAAESNDDSLRQLIHTQLGGSQSIHQFQSQPTGR